MRSKTRGFTLVELLTVIALIGTLVSLMLPAAQSGREAARRIACANNLRQLGIGLHGYHAAMRVLPPAWFGNESDWANPHWSWSAYILPYLDQSPLYERLGATSKPFGNGVTLVQPSANTQIVLAIFACPSDAGPALNQRKGLLAKSNYRGVAGNQTDLYGDYDAMSHQNGMLYLNSSLPLSEARKGLSQTMLLGECSLTPGDQGHVATLWAGMRGTEDYVIYESDATWWVQGVPGYCINGSADQAVSSMHPGGAQFLYCDGSVHFLKQDIADAMLDHLAARDDGLSAGGY